jgi:hypothetical protein
MKLKSFGCSFIFGTDLHDDSRLAPKATASNFTWPALLAQRHGWDSTCYARPGAGNLEIAERLLSQLCDTEPAVYVIGWSWIDRFSYTNTHNKWFGSPWHTIMPIDTNAKAEIYYRDIHSEMRDKLTTLLNVRVAIDSLKQRGHRFIMTYMDDLMFDDRWNTTPAICDLQGYCLPHMTRFDNKNLLDWSKQQGFEISATMHPLEAAHRAAFELIDSYNLV